MDLTSSNMSVKDSTRGGEREIYVKSFVVPP